MCRRRASLRSALFLVPMLVRPIAAYGQPIRPGPEGDRAVRVEIFKPAFDQPGFSFRSSAVYLSARWRLSDVAKFVAELPVALGGLDDTLGYRTDATVGNPYIGAEIRGRETLVVGEFGVRLPLTKESGDLDFAPLVGVFADFVDRAEAFSADILSLHAAVRYEYESPGGLSLVARFAPVFWIDTGDAFADMTELLFVYGANVGYRKPPFAVSGGLRGRLMMTEVTTTIGGRSAHEAVAAAAAAFGRFQPGVQVRLPLDDDLRDVLDLVVGVSLGVALP
jgi:hypothetical protein